MASKLTWEWVTALLAGLPETEFVEHSGPFPRGVVRVRGKTIAYPAGGTRGSPPDTRPGDEFVFVKTSAEERAALFTDDPFSFFTTPHYRSAPGVIVRLSSVDPEQLRELLNDAWRLTASKRVVAEYDQRTTGSSDDGRKRGCRGGGAQ